MVTPELPPAALASYPNESDEPDGTPATKRRRIALSCTDCRKRKLKCDREYPICSRCREGRHPERCTYDPNAVDELIPKPPSTNGSANNHVPFKDDTLQMAKSSGTSIYRPPNGSTKSTAFLETRIEQLEHRIVGLERLINLSSQSPFEPDVPSLHSIVQSVEPSSEEFLEFRGKGCGTSFHGASHPQAYLTQMPSLRIFVREMIVQHPRAKQVRDQLKKLKFKRPKTRPNVINHPSLLSILPERDIVEHYVKLYVETFETFYRVLHVPSFWSDYEKLWDSPHDAETMTLVHVILMVAAVYCLPASGNATGVGVNRDLLPAAQDTACYWIESCETWLDSQSQKHSRLDYLQAQCLLYIAKTMQCFKLKRSWTAAGTLMDYAITRGFHRNIDIVNKQQGDDIKVRVSRFSQEMRRRLWSTIVELEMMAALERGMPTSLPDLISDCGVPHNCDDEYLKPGNEREPPSLPDSVFSRTSYQSISSKSLQLRQQVLSIINGSLNPNRTQFDDISTKLTKHLDEIPAWTSSESTVPSALLQLQLLELIMFLHRRHSPSSPWSRTLHIKAAKSILDTHQRLIATSHFVLTVLRHDVASAAVAICYDFETNKSIPRPIHNLLTSNDMDHLVYLSTALSILDRKIDWMGVGVKAYYIVAACEGLLKKRKEYAGNQEAMAAEKVTALMERMVGRLEGSRGVSMANSLSNGASSSTASIVPSGEAANGAQQPQDPLLMNSANLGDFSFDLRDWDLNSFLNF